MPANMGASKNLAENRTFTIFGIMKTIAEIIEEWKAVNEPLLEGVKICFEKDCNFTEVKEIYEGVKIDISIRDRFTQIDGVPHEKSFVAVFFARYQGNADATLKAIETKQFEVFLQAFTRDFVESRRKELLEMKACGYTVDFGTI